MNLKVDRDSIKKLSDVLKPPLSGHHHEAAEMDASLLRLIQSDKDKSVRFENLEPKSRLWVHRRCQQLGLTSATDDGNANCKGMQVKKPEGWTFVLKEIYFESSKKRAKAKKKERMSEWSTACDNCGAELSAWEALYNYSGIGPLCQECIDEDEELAGLKWEQYAEFGFTSSGRTYSELREKFW